MPRKRNAVPKVHVHKATGQAYVKITQDDGTRKTIYLGRADDKDKVHAEFLRVVGGREPGEPPPAFPLPPHDPPPIAIPAPARVCSVQEVYDAFMEHARVYYRLPSGEQSSEVRDFAESFRQVLRLYGSTPAEAFGVDELKEVREEMIRDGWARKLINQRVGRVKHAFGWAAEGKMVSPGVALSLRIVKGLKANRSAAPEREPVEAAPLADVLKAAEAANRVVAAMIRLQLWSGMRPGEVAGLMPGEIDRTAEPWVADLSKRFKMAYRGLKRRVHLGPRCREILSGLARWDEPDEPVFRPKDTVEDERKRRLYGTSYSKFSYGQAVERACVRAGVSHFTPNQIRHTHATLVRRSYGLEGAQVALGHEHAAVTEIYAEKDEALARRIAEEMG